MAMVMVCFFVSTGLFSAFLLPGGPCPVLRSPSGCLALQLASESLLNSAIFPESALPLKLFLN